MDYEHIKKLTTQQITKILQTGTDEEKADALVSAALYLDDADWVENLCVEYSTHKNPLVRGNAVLGFAHLARIHKKIDTKKIIPILKASLTDPDPYVRGHAESAMDDIEMFVK